MFQADPLPAISEVWSSSTLLLPESAEDVAVVAARGGGIIPIVIAALAVACIIFLRSIGVAFFGTFGMITSSAKRRDLMGDNSFIVSQNILTFIAAPIYALILSIEKISSHNYWWTLAIIAGYILLRTAVFVISGWLNRDKEMLKEQLFFRSMFNTMVLLSAPALAISYMAAGGAVGFCRIYIAAVAVIALIAYIYNSFKTIISSRFSHFFSFLYLCGLELLPIAVVVKILVL